ncbi:hypothetical protein BGZ83_001074 [Gryganskiella cystojenkinii]|nr:hypothetical protein BGZ83_001074 [Gryganskiella cystojenkinii]
MKIVAVAPLLLLGAALASIEGAPLDNRHSSSNNAMYQDWNEAIELARNKSGTPGLSVAALHHGKVIYDKGFGKRNNRGDPVTAETLMAIGSMTKAMTAAMIGELVAEGKLDWDRTPVSEYVPEAQFGPVLTSELTLSDYLSHRTGLPHDDTPWSNTTETRAQVFRRLKHLNLPEKLSTKLQYSNIGYAIAGEAAANVAKIPYERLVRNKIFRPLGLTHTGFSPIEMGRRPNHARPFYADTLKDAQAGNFHQGFFDTLIELDAAAGDIYSNVYDLVRWGSTIMHYGKLEGKQILNKTSVEELLSARTIVRDKKTIPELSPVTTYGMGWFIDSYKGQAVYYHAGNTLGFSSMIVLFPDSDLVITVLSNVVAAQLANTIPYYLADEILSLPRTIDWLGKETMDTTETFFKLKAEGESDIRLPPRLKNKPAAHAIETYVGEYAHPLFTGNVKITLASNEGNLDADGFEQKGKQLHFLFNTFASKMEHYHYETFTYLFDLWSVKTKLPLTFITGQDGQVEALQLTYLEDKWTFKKQQAAKETKPLSSSSMLLTDMETMTPVRIHCDDQVEVDIRMENEEGVERETSAFGEDHQVHFKLF